MPLPANIKGIDDMKCCELAKDMGGKEVEASVVTAA
jgi:hypothetical protein